MGGVAGRKAKDAAFQTEGPAGSQAQRSKK